MSPCFSFLIENKTKNPGIPLVYPISKWDNYNIHVFYLRVHQQGSMLLGQRPFYVWWSLNFNGKQFSSMS